MSFAPASITAIGIYLGQHDAVNLGIVGDAAHRARASYHNGQDAITTYGRTAANDYTIRQPRDREPYLSNAASAIDIGRIDGTLVGLRDFSNWLYLACRNGQAGTNDIREVIFSPDGTRVLHWDNYTKQLYAGGDGTGHGDNSHLWHTHISFWRDSEFRDKTAIFRAYFEKDEDMNAKTHRALAVCTVAAGSPLYTTDTGTGYVIGSDGKPVTSFNGGAYIWLYAMPRATTGRAAILIDRLSGTAEDLVIAWVDAAKVTNIRMPGTVSQATYDTLNAALTAAKTSAAADETIDVAVATELRKMADRLVA